MKIIRAILLTIISAALALYLACCLVGNSWNPMVAADAIVAASSNKSEQIVKEAGYSTEWTSRLPEGFSPNDGYVYYKNAEVTMDEALARLGFVQSGKNGRNEWITPSGTAAKISSVTFSPGGKMVHYITTGAGADIDVQTPAAPEQPTEAPAEAQAEAPTEAPTEAEAPAEEGADETPAEDTPEEGGDNSEEQPE